MKKNAIIIIGPAVEDTEFAYPYYRLQEEGFKVDVASNNGIDIIAKHGLPIKVNKAIQNINSADYDLLVIPGGLESPDRLRQIPKVLEIIREFNETGKLIASICHGPWVLISAGIVKNRKMTCYVGCKDDLINAGAIYLEQETVVDNHIVTAPHFRNNHQWLKQIIQTYCQLNK